MYEINKLSADRYSLPGQRKSNKIILLGYSRVRIKIK